MKLPMKLTIALLFISSSLMWAQTRPQTDSSSRKKPPVVKPRDSRDSVYRQKRDYPYPKDSVGKDSNKVGSRPR